MEGCDETLRKLYRTYRRDFMSWAKSHFKLDESILEDAFQDALEIFYRNVMMGKLKSLNTSLLNYLVGIGRFKLLQYLDKNNRIDYPDTIGEEKIKAVEDFLEIIILSEIQDEKVKRLQNAFDKLSATCQILLRKRFYEDKSIDAITQEMKYENANTTNAALSRCIKNLRRFFD